MILPINLEYQIAGYEHGWIVQRARVRKGKICWRNIAYFSSLEAAVNSLGDRLVRTSNTATLTEALIEVEKLATQLSRALTIEFEVKRKSVRCT